MNTFAVTASGAVGETSKGRKLAGLSVLGVGTVHARENDASGRILGVCGSDAANKSGHFTPPWPVDFSGQLYLEVTGTPTRVVAYEL